MSSKRQQTIRQEIITILEKGPLTPRDISRSVSISEKDVPHHLESIEKSLRHQEKQIHMEPYSCLDCGYQFKRRASFKKPSKCPICKDGRIASAIFKIVPQGN